MRGIFRKLAKIYDPLGFVSPITMIAKLICREVLDANLPWDAKLRRVQLEQWQAWERSLPKKIEGLISIVKYQEPINEGELHSFGDALTKWVGAAVYAVAGQPSGTTQQLVAAKSSLAKRNLSIPRLQLVAAHMATNLWENVYSALSAEPQPSKVA